MSVMGKREVLRNGEFAAAHVDMFRPDAIVVSFFDCVNLSGNDYDPRPRLNTALRHLATGYVHLPIEVHNGNYDSYMTRHARSYPDSIVIGRVADLRKNTQIGVVLGRPSHLKELTDVARELGQVAWVRAADADPMYAFLAPQCDIVVASCDGGEAWKPRHGVVKVVLP